MAQTSTITIDKFLGINLSNSGDTNLKIGELSKCNNIRIIDNYKARKREGYEELFSSITSKKIQGMWHGSIGGAYRFLFACGGFLYRDKILSGTVYDSLDTSTYTHVDVVKTTALDSLAGGTTGIDGATHIKNRVEISQADIDNVASVGKHYYHTDKTVWLIVAKGTYSNIANARTGLGNITVYHRIGALNDDVTNMFFFDVKLYIIDGNEYYSWSGTGVTSVVVGHRPVLATSTPYGGGGTANQGANLLNGLASQYFNGDGTHATFHLRESNIDSVDAVRVGGVTQTVTTHYTVDKTAGTVTFTTGNIPTTAINNIEIDWTKGTGSRSTITAKPYYNIYGAENDSRIFIYGDGTNQVYFSGLVEYEASAEYFPELNVIETLSSEHEITSLANQQDRMMIYTTRQSYYSLYDNQSTEDAYLFPTYLINDKIGNIPCGQCQIINNNPVTFMNGVYEWLATQVKDERNAILISDRIQSEIDSIDLSTIITCDFENKHELWITTGSDVYIYNYRLNVWYTFSLNDTPSCFIEIDNELYFGTTNGQIMKFDELYLTDNGTKIIDEMITGNLDFGVNWKDKFLQFSWIGLQPESRSIANISWISDYSSSTSDEVISYVNLDYENIDYSDWSYLTSYNPQPFRIKIKAKKFTYIKFVISCNSETDKMTILSITLPSLVGGISK